MESSYSSSTTKPLYRGTQIIWYILGLVEVLLLFRFVLKLLAANSGAAFTGFIYAVSGFLVTPFVSVFRVTYIEGSVFEWTTLLAILVYWVVALGVSKLLVMGKTVSTPEAAVKLNREESA